jgi:hypothetical protein
MVLSFMAFKLFNLNITIKKSRYCGLQIMGENNLNITIKKSRYCGLQIMGE